jgi:uncharacterized protein YkwD
MWKKWMHPASDVDHPFSVEPSASSPYSAGSLKAAYIQDGVNAVNFYRFISGLPADITTTDQLNQRAQYGAVLLASEGQFSHTPDQPSDMSKDFYDRGYASTSSANIYASFGYNDHIVAHSIDAYMEDSDVDNLRVVGHRRWILNPPLKVVGIGLAESDDNWMYSALQVFDKSRTEQIGYHYISYPSAGLFPIEVFKPNYAWSVSLNKNEYAAPTLKQVSVSLKRLRDNKTWTLTDKNNIVAKAGNYMNVENRSFGTGSVVIFRPGSIDEYRAGDRFEVTLNGLKGIDGSSKTISYAVEFMSADNYVPKSPTPNPPTPTPPNPSTGTVKTHFTDIDKSWAKPTIEWAVGLGIVSDVSGPFRPTESITEEEFLKMFVVAVGGEATSTTAGRWSDKYYEYAGDNGYNLHGNNNSKARTSDITRLSVAELIASAAGQTYTGDSAIQFLLDNGYSNGKTSPTVAGYIGKDSLTRAEAVQFIKNLLDADYHP